MKPLFYPVEIDAHGKISISKEEFKKILDEAYESGWYDGVAERKAPSVNDWECISEDYIFMPQKNAADLERRKTL